MQRFDIFCIGPANRPLAVLHPGNMTAWDARKMQKPLQEFLQFQWFYAILRKI